MRIRIVILVGVTIVMCSYLLVAQESESKKNSLQEGMWAMQFQINNNFTLSSFQGTTISVKRHYSPTTAIRLGTSLSFSFDNRDGSSTNTLEPNPRSDDSNGQSLDVRVQYLWYPSPASAINMYFGAGPLVGLSHSKQTFEQSFLNNGQPVTSVRTDEGTAWGIGISGVLGLEWFATASIAFNAEYGSSMTYAWQKQVSSITLSDASPAPGNESTRHSFGLFSSGVRFGLSAYF
ncbi:MAG: hypothetical protein HY033_11875 [Ignavibacteriae bacterium]|nr:hypothetical protein [Ignavibacteriota bacterium]